MGYGYGYGYPMMYGDYGIGHAIFSIFSIVVLIMVIIMAIRFLRGKPMGHGRHHWCGWNSALETLKERYAKGEIDRAEFEQKKKDLEA